MPGKDGVEVARAIRDERLPVRTVLLTAHKSEALVNRALDSGVSGYVLKDGGALTEIVECCADGVMRAPWVESVPRTPQPPRSSVTLASATRAGGA